MLFVKICALTYAQQVVKYIFNSKLLGYLIELNKTLENSLSHYKFHDYNFFFLETLDYNVNNILNDYIIIYYLLLLSVCLRI